ncbi:MAG: RnfABCDGE type electron transport complex subunit G [Oscillospiraceae bacterium]|jgi:electron transport complex protein RnfG|nr:RnfABCDGE type electron transport complex subunit G [Oscillospiraceae bacterium]
MKKIVKPAIALTAICLVCVVALAITNSLTKPKITALSEAQRTSAMLELLPAASSFDGAAERTIETDGGTAPITFFCARDAKGELIGYVFITSAAGYGGDISVMTAADTGAKVLGVKILEISETPGLGMRAQEAGFLGQFIGKLAGISVTKDGADTKQIQAITGATITSNAVTQAVNNALQAAGDEFLLADDGADLTG